MDMCSLRARTVKVVCVCLSVVLSLASGAADDRHEVFSHSEIPPFSPSDIAALGDRVLVLEFSAPDCNFCWMLREEVLHPVLKSAEMDNSMLLRSVHAWGKTTEYAFIDGILVSGAQLSKRYQVSYTPTLVFVDRSGRQLAEPIHGISNLEFYGFYLEKQVRAALANM